MDAVTPLIFEGLTNYLCVVWGAADSDSVVLDEDDVEADRRRNELGHEPVLHIPGHLETEKL